MRKATKAAGIAGIEHGHFEILQGKTRPSGLMMVMAVILGLGITIWSFGFLHQKNAEWVLIQLSGALLLFGGGIFSSLIGIISGTTGTKINKPIDKKQHGTFKWSAARLWPWHLVLFMVWIIDQWSAGYFFNDFMQQAMVFGPLLILNTLPLSVYTAYGYDSLPHQIDGTKSPR